MTTPYIEFSYNTLDKLIAIHAGDMIVCCHCGEQHQIAEIKDMDDGNYTLQFVECGDQSFIVGVCGKRVDGVKADMSGRLDI